MDSTKSYIKIYTMTPEAVEFMEFDYDVEGIEQGSSDILTEFVPNLEDWGDIGWMEVEEYEYAAATQTVNLTLETKWESPVDWLCRASERIPYFQNRLITMTTIQKDETAVRGVAVTDGEVLQDKYIFEMDSETVGKYYDDSEEEYELDDLDNLLWDSINKFVNVCEQFYLEKEEEDND